jgi:hypothetical protein
MSRPAPRINQLESDCGSGQGAQIFRPTFVKTVRAEPRNEGRSSILTPSTKSLLAGNTSFSVPAPASPEKQRQSDTSPPDPP